MVVKAWSIWYFGGGGGLVLFFEKKLLSLILALKNNLAQWHCEKNNMSSIVIQNSLIGMFEMSKSQKIFGLAQLARRILNLRTFLVVYLSVPFLLKSSYTILRMLKCLKLYAWNCMWGQDTPDFMEISSYPCNCIIFIIKVINYTLWHTFESKRYMYFHNKTWYTCTHCYM